MKSTWRFFPKVKDMCQDQVKPIGWSPAEQLLESQQGQATYNPSTPPRTSTVGREGGVEVFR